MKTGKLRRVVRPTKTKALLIFAVLAGYAIGQFTPALVAERKPSVEDAKTEYGLLARRILVENPNDILIDFRPLQTRLETYIAQNGLEGDVSINFEYLPTGSSIGINENKQQVGASLLKLPLTMAVYKEYEAGKVSLDTMVPLQQEWLNNSFGNLYQKGAGYKISNRNAAKEALINSDNTAALLLFDQVVRAQGTQTPNLLGFIDANYGETPTHEVLIDSRSYSSILKCLYFACYLNKDNSQEILDYLTQSAANNRLRKYIPESTPIAHKIGTFNQLTQSDCGVFYVPQRNYVLCVMVDDKDPVASETIARISQLVHNYLTQQ